VASLAARSCTPSPVTVQSITIPLHRQFCSVGDVAVPMAWASGTPGGAPPAFARTGLHRGQILDVLDDHVRQHPEWFTWIERDGTIEDVRRLERLDQEEKKDG
jgi:hypothetical protein